MLIIFKHTCIRDSRIRRRVTAGLYIPLEVVSAIVVSAAATVVGVIVVAAGIVVTNIAVVVAASVFEQLLRNIDDTPLD